VQSRGSPVLGAEVDAPHDTEQECSWCFADRSLWTRLLNTLAGTLLAVRFFWERLYASPVVKWTASGLAYLSFFLISSSFADEPVPHRKMVCHFYLEEGHGTPHEKWKISPPPHQQ